MKPFTFQTTRSVLCEVGATAKKGEIMGARGCREVAFVTDEIILEVNNPCEMTYKAALSIYQQAL